MQELAANTEAIVLIGPFVAVGDGFTPVTNVTLGGADEAELVKNNATTGTDISANTWAVLNTVVDGFYNLTLSVTDTNTEGRLTVVVQDDNLVLPVKQEFMVLSQAAYDSKYAAKDAGWMDVNIKTVGRADSQETEATNLEAACAAYSVTRGLTGTAVPAAAADAVGGLPISDAGGLDMDALSAAIVAGFPTSNTADAEPGGGSVVTGTNTANDSDSTFLNDGTYWQIAAAAADGDGFGLSVIQVFTLGITNRVSVVRVNAKETLAGVIHVWAYNYLTTSWDRLSDTGTAISGIADNDYSYSLLPAHQQAGDGEVQIRYTSTSTETNKYLYLDQVLVQTVMIGNTLAEISKAVWAHILGNPDENTAAYALDKTRALVTTVATGDSTTSFTATAGVAVNDAYNGMLIMVEDETDDHYEVRRVTDYTSGRVFTVDRAFGFTPAAGDHIYLMASGYADVKVDGLAVASAGKLDDILDGTGGTGIKVNSIENTGTTTLTGAVSLGSTLGVTGAITLSSTLNVGAVTLASAAITGALSVGTTTTLSGAVSLGSTLGVTGATTLASLVVSGTTAFTGAVTMPAGLTANITGNITGTVSGNSTHSAANVYTAFGTGSNLTACATATSVTVSDKTGFKLASDGLAAVTAWTVDVTGTVSGNATASDVTTAHSTTDGLIGALVVPDAAGTALTIIGTAGANLTNIGAMHLEYLFKTTYDATSKPGAADALLNEMVINDAGVTQFSTNALENAPSGTGASAVSIRQEIDANSTQLALIVADTGELQTNQGAWATATSVTVSDKTGFKLASDGLAAVTAWTVDITGTVSGNSTHTAANVVTALGTGTTLSAVPWNSAWDTEVQSECNDALVANNLDHLMLTALSGGVSPTFAEIVDGTLLSWMMTIDGDTSDFVPSTDSLEALMAGTTGSGAYEYTVTITVGGVAVDNVAVWFTTDAAGANVVAGTLYTDALGQVTPMLDDGTYYVWKEHASYNFTNPQTIEVTVV